MDQKEITAKAEDLVTRVEDHKEEGLAKELHDLSPADRLAVAREMERISADHAGSNPLLPEIKIDSADAKLSAFEAIRTQRRLDYLNPEFWVKALEKSSDDVIYQAQSVEMVRIAEQAIRARIPAHNG